MITTVNHDNKECENRLVSWEYGAFQRWYTTANPQFKKWIELGTDFMEPFLARWETLPPSEEHDRLAKLQLEALQAEFDRITHDDAFFTFLTQGLAFAAMPRDLRINFLDFAEITQSGNQRLRTDMVRVLWNILAKGIQAYQNDPTLWSKGHADARRYSLFKLAPLEAELYPALRRFSSIVPEFESLVVLPMIFNCPQAPTNLRMLAVNGLIVIFGNRALTPTQSLEFKFELNAAHYSLRRIFYGLLNSHYGKNGAPRSPEYSNLMSKALNAYVLLEGGDAIVMAETFARRFRGTGGAPTPKNGAGTHISAMAKAGCQGEPHESFA